jgi:NifB/MoaA-like Fe-S oxidoreductase
LPKASFYDGYPQYTNGVGLTREFLDSWTKEARKLPQTLAGSFKLALVCGTLIATTLQLLAERLNKIGGLEVNVLALENTFFGSTVTVSGLLTGQDVVAGLRTTTSTQALLPRVMFDHQGLRTLDDYTPQSLAQASGIALTIIDGPRELVRFIQNLVAPEAPSSAE